MQLCLYKVEIIQPTAEQLDDTPPALASPLVHRLNRNSCFNVVVEIDKVCHQALSVARMYACIHLSPGPRNSNLISFRSPGGLLSRDERGLEGFTWIPSHPDRSRRAHRRHLPHPCPSLPPPSHSTRPLSHMWTALAVGVGSLKLRTAHELQRTLSR